MQMPTMLRKMDDRVLGDRLRKRPTEDGQRGEGTTTRDRAATDRDGDDRTAVHETTVVERPESARRRMPSSGDGARETLGIVYRISRAVFLVLAAAVALGIVFILAPTNADNVIVSNVLDLARDAAGPFRDVFTVADDAERETVVNYGFAAAVYLAVAIVVGKLPGGKSS